MVGPFRIEMARRCGERIARERGFDSFPVDPEAIAHAEEIEVVAKPPEVDGVSGGIIFATESPTIFYSTRIPNPGFQRFTIAHELGHYFLDGHPEAILAQGGAHASRAGFSQGGSSIEVEADHFAAGLLMPARLVRRALRSDTLGLDGIIGLADAAGCSLTAAAIRAAECGEYPLAIVVSKGSHVAYGFLSEAFKALRPSRFLRKGDPLPDTATRDFNADPDNVRAGRRRVALTSLQDWFGAERRLSLDEQVIGLGLYGYTLTVLSSEELSDDPKEEIEEEERLKEIWTPRFAYGR